MTVTENKPEVGTDLVGLGKVGVQLVQTGEKFIEMLFGSYLLERGEMLADGVRAKRHANLAVVGGLASQRIGEAEVHTIPGRILFPLAEGASNEDEPGLQGMWAKLLAQAATEPHTVSPAFPKILAEMSPADARILKTLFEWLYVSNHSTLMSLGDMSKGSPFVLSEILLSINNLSRLGLIEDSFEEAYIHGFKTAEDLHRLFTDFEAGAKITLFGATFLAACLDVPSDSPVNTLLGTSGET